MALFATLFSLHGCGRLGDPIPPEHLAPQAVKDLNVVATLEGVGFSWSSPKDDRRGNELKFLDGYRLYRKTIEKSSDIVDPDVPFELLSEVVDQSVATREKLRETARAEGKPARRLKADPALSQFNYTDRGLSPGTIYVYKLVPFNQGDVEGRFKNLIKVIYRGDNSQISMVEDLDLESSMDADEGLI